MPLYEYVCANGHRTEVMHGVHDTGPTACPVCGAAMRKAFVAPAIVFKGSGWAKVDRRSAGGKKAAADSAASDGTTTTESTTKAEPTSSANPSTTQPAPKTPSSATD